MVHGLYPFEISKVQLISINLENFRNIKFAELTFSSSRVFLIGLNAQGKTNLLEAIGLSSNLRSFRKSGMEGLVREDAKLSRLFYNFHHDNKDNIEVFFSFGNKGNKSLEVDGEKIRRFADYLGKFPVVCMSSRDFRLVRDGPSERRKWLDMVLSLSSQNYFNVLQSFHRSLRERNSLLKKNGSDREIDAFEKILVPSAIELIKLRKNAFPKLSDSFKKYCDLLTGKKEDASLIYLPDSGLEGGEEEYKNFFVNNRGKDRQFGSTRKGPHRDDFELCINGRNAKTFASEGQQKGLVLGLRFAEFDFLRNELEVVPIILADDILGELDPERRKNFNNLIPSDVQFFGTGTEFPFLDNSEKWQILKVNSGIFSLSNLQ